MNIRSSSCIAIALLIVTGCATRESSIPLKDDSVVRIGHVGPKTGPIAHLGRDNELGAKLAIEDLNQKHMRIGGKEVRFELVTEDDAADPRRATAVAERLVNAAVVGVVGHLNSGTSIPASTIYADAGIPQISPSATNPLFTRRQLKTTFRVVADDTQQARAMALLAIRHLQAKSIAIIDDRTAYGQGLGDYVESTVRSLNGNVVAHEYGHNKKIDWITVLSTIKAKNPDVVIYGGMDATAAPLLMQMRQMGITAKFIVGDGGCTPEMIKLSGSGMVDAYCTEGGTPRAAMPQGDEFFLRFKQRFGVDVQIYAPYTYDAVMVLAQAMQLADSTNPATYLPTLASLKLVGVTGPIEFDSRGDLKDGAITIMQYRAGRWASIGIIAGDEMRLAH